LVLLVFQTDINTSNTWHVSFLFNFCENATA
jgi:hypothetical protein